MNNKAINEFGFRRIWRIKQILEGVILLNLLNSSYPTQPHSLIANYESIEDELIIDTGKHV